MIIIILCLLIMTSSCTSSNNIKQEVIEKLDEEILEKLDSIIIKNSSYYFNVKNISNETTQILIKNHENKNVDTFVVESVFKNYLKKDLNNDGIEDLVLRFYEQTSCVFILLLHETSYNIPQYCDYNIFDIMPVQFHKNEFYATYTPIDCHKSIWESNLIKFTKDSFEIQYKVVVDLCDTNTTVLLTTIDGSDSLYKVLEKERAFFYEKKLEYLWGTFIEEKGIPLQK